MPELIIGGLTGLFVALYYGLDAGGSTVLAVIVATLAYLASCWGWPVRKCWRCEGQKLRGDGRGNLRARTCRVCKGRGLVRRAGSILIGRDL